MTININIPESWNQLNTRQLKQIAHLFHSNKSGVYFDYKAFLILLNVHRWQFLKLFKAIKIIRNVTFTNLKAYYSWLYSGLNITTFIPILKTKNKTLHAPADRITNLTVNEFAHADDLYLGWFKTKDFEYLQYLAAVLYRELDANGKRVVFDKTELDARAQQWKKIDKPTLLAIALSYQGCRSYLTAQFPIVFPKPTPNNKSKTPRNSGFGKLVLYMSGGKFGTHNETKNTNIYTFLSEFEEQLKKKPYA